MGCWIGGKEVVFLGRSLPWRDCSIDFLVYVSLKLAGREMADTFDELRIVAVS